MGKGKDTDVWTHLSQATDLAALQREVTLIVQENVDTILTVRQNVDTILTVRDENLAAEEAAVYFSKYRWTIMYNKL